MPKQYSIKWVIDDAQARGVFQRGGKAMRDLEAQALKAANAIQQAHAAAAASVVNGYARVNGVASQSATAVINGHNRIAASAAKQSASVLSIAQKEADQNLRIRVKDAAAREALRLKEIEAERHKAKKLEEFSASVAGPNGRLAQFKRRELTEEELQMAARNRAWDVHHKKRVDQILKERYETRDSFGEAIANATGFGSAMTVAGGALLAFGAAKGVVQGIAESLSNAKKAGESMAKQVLDTLSALREIAALKDKYAPDEEVLRQHSAIRLASGLSQEEAIGLEEQLSDTMGTVSKDKIGDADRAKIAVETARMAARAGGGARVKPMAEMVGVVADMIAPDAKGKVSADRVMQMAEAVNDINKLGSADERTSTTQAIKLMTALTAPGMVGTFQDPRRAVALSTIASKFAKEDSATATLQAVRELGAFTKFRKGKGVLTSQSQFLKDAGITEQMDPSEKMRKLFQHAEKDMKPDEAFDAYLKRHGVRTEEGATQLQRFYQEYRRGNFDRLMGSAGAPLTSDYQKRNAAFLGSQTGRDAVARAAVDAAKLQRGRAGTELTIGKQEAEAGLIASGLDDSKLGQWDQWIVGAMMGNLFGGGVDAGRRAIIERETIRNAQKNAGRKPGSGLGPLGEAARLIIGANTGALLPGQMLMGNAFGGYLGSRFGTAVSGAAEERAEELKQLRKIAENTGSTPTPPPIPIIPPPSGPLR